MEKFLEDENNVDNKSNVEKLKDFNILIWWETSSERYPIVFRIAGDVLDIPMVASESAFSTSGSSLSTKCCLWNSFSLTGDASSRCLVTPGKVLDR
ncbi:hypothetical protein HAX54_007926 [Datura stramonium]|uniref:HAT C-terminal dimerisation domain-containing protein n=1 Tax=Datura stramonium TaxID=4076 RepID=A0ABS8TEW1_DATST|nr:hypothetical protein [Datura stramonium]